VRFWRRKRAGREADAAPAAYSLRRRLIVSVLGASVVLWLVSLFFIVRVAWHETSDVFDDALKESARLALVLGDNLQRQGVLEDEVLTGREPTKVRLYYQLVAADGRVLRRAERAPEQAFVPSPDKDKGYRNVFVGGEPWRVYLLRSREGGFSVQVGQPWRARTEILQEMAEDLVWPALAVLLVLATVCWLAIRQLLRPIERTAARIAAKSPDDLCAVPLAHEPRELQPIVRALNTVLGRLDGALQSERRFTADAAHELRTPLAALRTRIQLMQRQQAGPAPGLQQLREDVDRCTALVENLLALARLDPEQPAGLACEAVPLAPLLATLAADFRHGPAAARGMVLEIEAEADTAWAHPALLQSALRNLLDNAARYGAAPGRVRLEARPLPHGAVRLSVRDDGPGVPAAERARLTERFFRVLGTGAAGSGLGLSIVARIAALHGAALRFESGLGGSAGEGLGVVLELPGPARPGRPESIRKP